MLPGQSLHHESVEYCCLCLFRFGCNFSYNWVDLSLNRSWHERVKKDALLRFTSYYLNCNFAATDRVSDQAGRVGSFGLHATGLIRTSIALVISVILAVGIGILWKPKLWAINAGIFYAIFIVFFTSMFTNGQGFFTGLVGSLGYWLSQQAVNRGTQPWYFYAFLQIPMYEYLAALGAFLGLILGIKHKLFTTFPSIAPAMQADDKEIPTQIDLPITEDRNELILEEKKLPVLTLLLYWSVISLIAYSVAGEKMPWLTVHITLPMLLAAGFSVGFLVDRVKSKTINLRALLAFVLVPIFLISLGKDHQSCSLVPTDLLQVMNSFSSRQPVHSCLPSSQPLAVAGGS